MSTEPLDVVLNSLQNNVKQIDVVSNNIANANTPGFMASEVFAEFSVDTANPLRQIISTKASSAIINTDRTLDVAMTNPGFLMLELEGESVFTRHGRLHIDASSQLKHLSGALVVGQSGPIVLPEGDVQINAEGIIYVNGEEVERLMTVTLEENAEVRSIGNSVYSTQSDYQIIDNNIQQGAINGANAEVSRDMIRMIELSRHTQSLQKAVLAIDQAANAGINELGKR